MKCSISLRSGDFLCWLLITHLLFTSKQHWYCLKLLLAKCLSDNLASLSDIQFGISKQALDFVRDVKFSWHKWKLCPKLFLTTPRLKNGLVQERSHLGNMWRTESQVTFDVFHDSEVFQLILQLFFKQSSLCKLLLRLKRLFSVPFLCLCCLTVVPFWPFWLVQIYFGGHFETNLNPIFALLEDEIRPYSRES